LLFPSKDQGRDPYWELRVGSGDWGGRDQSAFQAALTGAPLKPFGDSLIFQTQSVHQPQSRDVTAEAKLKLATDTIDAGSLQQLTDEELVIAHLDGRTGAFDSLYARYRDRLVHFIIRKTGDADRAQDLVQEAFIRVTRHLHRFDTSKKFSTWVYTIASNLSKNELRNRSRSPLVLFQKLTNSWEDDHRPIQFEDARMRPDDLYRKRFLRRLVEETVEELPEHPRLVFRLRELEGKSYEEIAEITGVNLGTVKSRLHRARNSFAQRIEPHLN